MNRLLSVIAAFVLLLHTAHAKADDVLPTVNPANVMDAVGRTLTVPNSARPNPRLEDANAVAPSDTPEAGAPVLLKEVKVIGALHPMPSSVTAVYQPLIGHTVTFGAIQKMVADMQTAYRNAGEFLVRVILPPQEIAQDNGTVQVRVVEGQIEKVVFAHGLPRAVDAQMQRYVRTVEQNDPISYASVDRFLLLANDLPGMQVSATLVPNAEVTGGSDLQMTTTHQLSSSFINFNNYGSKYIGPNQMSLGTSLYDIVAADSLSVAIATTPKQVNELGYGNIDYGVVLGPQSTRVNASATVTKTEPGNSLKAFDMSGKSREYKLDIQQPLLVSTPRRLTLLVSLSHLDSHNDVFDDQRLYEDKVTPLTLGIAYQGVIWQAYHDVKFTATRGLSLLGTPRNLSNPSVAGADPEFTHFNFESSAVRYLVGKASVSFSTQFQFSHDRLISSERLSYGGARFGQAYVYNVISGDSGALGSLALRYDLQARGWLNQLQPEVFYDAGAIHLNDTPAGDPRSAKATSAGLGMNLQLLDRVKVRMTLAKPLSIDNAPQVDRAWQGFFNVTGQF